MKTIPASAEAPLRISSEHKPAQPVLRSQHLFGDAQEVIIEHLGEAYRLRRTRNGKLLLYK